MSDMLVVAVALGGKTHVVVQGNPLCGQPWWTQQLTFDEMPSCKWCQYALATEEEHDRHPRGD